MRRTIKLLFNFSFITLVLFCLIIVYSENTNTFNQSISNKIINNLKDNFSVNTVIESVEIKWKGINPSIYVKNIEVKDKENKTLLKTPVSEIKINLFDSFFSKSASISEIIINDTSLSLVYEKSKLFINDLNLISDSKVKNNNTSLPKIVLNNSEISINDKLSNKKTNFKVKNFTANYNNGLKINAKFFHESSLEPITIIYRGKYISENFHSQIYISGNSVKLPLEILPTTFNQVTVDRLSMRLWINLKNTSIEKISGNISSHNLVVILPKLELKLKNVNGDILYTSDKVSDTLSLLRLNYEISNKKINNNKIVINKTKSKEIRLFVQKSDYQILNYISQQLNISNVNDIIFFDNAQINNIQVNMSRNGMPDYYSFSIKSPSQTFYEKYNFSEASVDVYGNMNKGKVRINNLSLHLEDNKLINNLKGSLTYNLKGKSIYFSSSNLVDTNGTNFKLSGNKTSQSPSLKLSVSSTLKTIKDTLNPIFKISFPELDGNLTSRIYFHKGIIFTNNRIDNLYVKQSDSVYLSSDAINMSTTSRLINSDSFKLSINNKIQKSKLTTIMNARSLRYKLTSVGMIDGQLLSKIFQVNTNYIDGESLAKSNIIYDVSKDKQKLTLFLSSDLHGLSANFFDFMTKTPNEKINLSLKYQHYPAKPYPLKISLNEHEMDLKYDDTYFYIKLNSPTARGLIKTPKTPDDSLGINGSFEFIDTSNLDNKIAITSLPNINLKSRHLKANGIIFDNVHIKMTQNGDYIDIDRLDFKNPYLEMKSSGKWYLREKQSTALNATVKSDNLGLALKSLGYSDAIRGGVLAANLNGNWKGALSDFSFSELDGNLDFTVQNGQINQLDKGTQAIGQVLGLFSIASIPKRLSLDFSDFFSKGLSFDNLNANVTLNSGIADTKKMIIIGSFGEMRLTGESNLINKTHDQVLVFIPDLSSTSLVTGAVLGGPIGAAASIFYDKLLKEFGVDTNKLAGIEYSIKGPWVNPKIKVTQSFKPILN